MLKRSYICILVAALLSVALVVSIQLQKTTASASEHPAHSSGPQIARTTDLSHTQKACCPIPPEETPSTAASPFAVIPDRGLADIPESPFRDQLLAAPNTIRESALRQFNKLGIAIEDAQSLHMDEGGQLFYACRALPQSAAQPILLNERAAEADALLAAAAIPVSEPPVYHSKPGAPKTIYLDFNGAVISGTAWNSETSTLNAYAWSKDSDYENFSDTEQNIIRQIWQRMAEDYAPFDVNVTTDPAFDPDNTGGSNSTGWVLFTRNVDTSGADMPHKDAGGVAYLNVFGSSFYASYYSPALVYANNLGPNVEHFMAEAGSHEMGHNLGLSHDGSSTKDYYDGHAAGSLRWAPIMGASYNDDITTWSKGDYADANQKQDDLAIISSKLGVEPVDVGNSIGTASELVFSGSSIVDPLTRSFISDDPNEGIIQSPTDVDYYSFTTGGGDIQLNVETFNAEDIRYSLGPNLDVKLRLFDSEGTVLLTADPMDNVSASITTTLPSGTYYLAVEGTEYGDPFNSPATGYTDYGSLGMYFISGSVPPLVTLSTPVADSAYDPGSICPIAWEGTSSGQSINIELLSSGGLSSVIATGIGGSENNYSWAIPLEQEPGTAYQIRLIVTDGVTTEATSGTFTITESPTYGTAEDWRIAFFDSPDNLGDGADESDFDKDGIVNVLERAFRTIPTSADSVYRPQQTIVSNSGQNYLALTYTRPVGGTGSTGVDYTMDGIIFTVEYASSLNGPWQYGSVTEVSISPPDNGMESVTVRLNEPVPPNGRQFMRLKVTATLP